MLHANFIGGEWLESSDVNTTFNPANTEEVVGTYARANADSVDAAVLAAKEAQPDWAAASPQVRHDVLEAAGAAIMDRKEELGRLLSREEGKTLAEGIGEAGRAAQIFKFFAGECLRVRGEKLDSIRPGIEIEIAREALGIIGLITPWNFPIAIPAWKIAPALCYGNAVILKPAEIAPGCAWELTKILEQSGLPKGVLNLVMGGGSDVGERMVEHPDIDGISFTGSVNVGNSIALKCAQTGKKTQMEMGGKNPMVILDDADLATAVSTSANGAYFSTGQRCTASSRLIVAEGIHDAFVEGITKFSSDLIIGDPLDAATQIGPVVSQSQLDQNLSYVDLAKQEGCEVLGGDQLDLDKPGFYQAPALFVGANNDMRVSREEIFGPCASIIKVADFEEALAISNATEFGLCAGICTSSLKYATEFRRKSQTGMVMVNLPTAGVDYHVPFGGRKRSSHGPREQGSYAAEFYTVVKTSYISS